MNLKEYPFAKTEKEAEHNLAALIKKYALEEKVSVEKIRAFILNDTGGDVRKANKRYYDMAFAVLANLKEEELNDALQAFTDAWNCFPHKALNGGSPIALVQEAEARGGEGTFLGGFPPMEILAELYRMARERGKREHARLGGTPAEFARIENELSRIRNASDENRVADFMAIHGIELLRRTHATMPETAEPYMREMQAMMNHRSIDTEDMAGSVLLFHALDTFCQGDERAILKFDVPCFMVTLLESHRIIDAYATKKNFEYRLASVAHHILDWLAMETPRRFWQKEPGALAAFAFGIGRRVDETVTTFASPVGTNEELAKLGGWKSAGSFASALSTAFYDVIYAVRDPHMLISDAENAPDDWFARLKVIAPSLEDHFDDSSRPPAGSVPSPYL